MKIFIKRLLREGLNESITAGSFVVYHRTNDEPKLFNKGIDYKRGTWNLYGSGLYTTYEFNGQLTDYMRKTYGPKIVEFKVNNNGGFLILDYDEAKKVYGTKYSLINQLKKIMKGYFTNFYRDNKNYLDKWEELLDSNGIKTSDIAANIHKLDGFISHVDGLVFTGDGDGGVFLLYNTKLSNPIRYTDDEGRNWKSIKDVSSHKIGRESGGISKIYNNLHKGIIGPNDKLMLLKDKNFVDNINRDDLSALLNRNTEEVNNKIKDVLLSNDTFLSKLGHNNGIPLSIILDGIKEVDKLITHLISNFGLLEKLSVSDIYDLVAFSDYPDKIINLLNSEQITTFISSLKGHKNLNDLMDMNPKNRNKITSTLNKL